MIIIEFICNECDHDRCDVGVSVLICTKCGHEEGIWDAKIN